MQVIVLTLAAGQPHACALSAAGSYVHSNTHYADMGALAAGVQARRCSGTMS